MKTSASLVLFWTIAWSQAPRFQNVAAEAGLRFILANSPTADKRMVETMPGGVAAFDFDNDGRIDIFFTNGAAVPSMEKDSSGKHSNRLFRNEGNWKFRDVTETAGVQGTGYSMGVAAGDFDNDGHVDLFVAGVRQNILYRNLGNGKFEDITARSGIKSDEWSITAGFFDYDNDGLIDLLVVNYGRDPNPDRFCGDTARAIRIYCHPKYFDGRPNQLYRNLGGGKFEDVSVKSGIAAHKGRGMSVAFADYDDDGKIDAFVSNDNLPNFLFRNLGGGRFEETGLLAGVALLDHGKPIASMGADFRDVDNDGRPDLSVTALTGETFPFFRNDGKGMFHDATYESRLGPLSSKFAGWANGWNDFNNDGWKDLFTANSHVNDLVEKFEPAVYRQPNSVFVNDRGKFSDAADAALAKAVAAHRGAAFADFDGDGKVDVVVTVLGEPAELWRNVTEGAGNWIDIDVRKIGTRVRIGDQWNHFAPAVGYGSSSHTPVHFGVGKAETVPRIEVMWPDGSKKVVENVKVNQTIKP